MLLKRLDTQTNTQLAAQHWLEKRQVTDEELFVTHLKNLNDNFTQDLKQYTQDLQSEMINKHIQGLRNEIQFDPTLTDLQEDVEQLGRRIDSLCTGHKLGRHQHNYHIQRFRLIYNSLWHWRLNTMIYY